MDAGIFEYMLGELLDIFKKPPDFAALTRGRPRSFPAKGEPLEMYENTARACVLCSVFCVLCSVFCVLCSVFNYDGRTPRVKAFCKKSCDFCVADRRSTYHGKSIKDWRGSVNAPAPARGGGSGRFGRVSSSLILDTSRGIQICLNTSFFIIFLTSSFVEIIKNMH